MITEEKIVFKKADIIALKVRECAAWIDILLFKDPDLVICPIMQSSFLFSADVISKLSYPATISMAGVEHYDSDMLLDDLYIYKAPDPFLYKNKKVLLLDVISHTGGTLRVLSDMVSQLGATKVYKAVLVQNQFTQSKLDWVGFKSYDEVIYGYGIDYKGAGRNHPELLCV